MRPILYYDQRSPPVRSVLLLINALNIDVELKLVDLFQAEHLKEDFLKVYPFHTVPCLQHEDLLLTDSHAILMYLNDIFGKGSKYEIIHVKQRAKIFNILMFNATILFEREKIVMRKIFSSASLDFDPKEIIALEEAIDYIEAILKQNQYIAGEQLSIADFSVVASISTINLILPIDQNRWYHVNEWLNTMKNLEFYEKGNQSGLDDLKEAMNKIITKEISVESSSHERVD